MVLHANSNDHPSHVIIVQECNIEEGSDEEEPPAPPAKSSKDKKANGPDSGKAPSLVFKLTSKVPYKTVLKGMYVLFFHYCCLLDDIPPTTPPPPSQKKKSSYNPMFNSTSICLAAHSAVVLKAESMADKTEWMNKIRSVIQPSKAGQLKGTPTEGGMRQSLSDGSLVSY